MKTLNLVIKASSLQQAEDAARARGLSVVHSHPVPSLSLYAVRVEDTDGAEATVASWISHGLFSSGSGYPMGSLLLYTRLDGEARHCCAAKKGGHGNMDHSFGDE